MAFAAIKSVVRPLAGLASRDYAAAAIGGAVVAAAAAAVYGIWRLIRKDEAAAATPTRPTE